MADYKLKALRGLQRRRFLKLMTMAGAGLGVYGDRLLNFLSDRGGYGLAEAATSSGHRALAVTCGNGVYAWFQQLWPVPEVAREANKDQGFGNTSSWLYTPAHGLPMGGYRGVDYMSEAGRSFYYGPDAPWFDHATGRPIRPMTAMMAGNDETHTEFPESATTLSGNADLPAAVGSIQSVNSSAIVPVLGIDPVKYGDAQGAPDVVTAPSPEGIVDLFNSAASRGLLFEQEDQQLFETYYKAFVGLRRAAERSSWQPQLEITKNAARLIGLNFESSLTPLNDDLINYGIDELLQSGTNLSSNQRAGLDAFGRTLITVAKAFALGLSNSAIVGLSPGPTSEQTFTDPHETDDSANNRDQARETTRFLGKMLDAFYNDLAQSPDPESPGQNIDETTVFFAWGDTPHTPLQLSNWPDATPMDSNWIYCMGQGHLQEGWFGGMDPLAETVETWDPATGANVDMPASVTANAASAAIAYAVARGDMNTVAQYYTGGPIDGVIKQ